MKPVLKNQKGGTALGVIIGLLLGLGVALVVALYVTHTPMPLINKAQQRTPEQDAAEAERNKNWDPNAGLIGKPTTRPPAPVPTASAPAAPASDTAVVPRQPAPALPTPADMPRVAPVPASAPASSARSTRDAAAILNGQSADGKPAPAAAATGAETDAFMYFVQVGAYSKPEDAEQQRAKLALAGIRATVTEREQNGRVVHRVRLGPFDRREDAEAQLDRAKAVDPEASIVRVDRTKQ